MTRQTYYANKALEALKVLGMTQCTLQAGVQCPVLSTPKNGTTQASSHTLVENWTLGHFVVGELQGVCETMPMFTVSKS